MPLLVSGIAIVMTAWMLFIPAGSVQGHGYLIQNPAGYAYYPSPLNGLLPGMVATAAVDHQSVCIPPSTSGMLPALPSTEQSQQQLSGCQIQEVIFLAISH